MASPLASTLSGMTGTASANGSVESPVNSGRSSSSGNRVAPGGRGTAGGATSRQVAAAVVPPRAATPPAARPPQPKAGPPRQPRFSATNPMLMTQPPPVPHPGLAPPYPDARSGAVQLMPNGLPVMPPPHGFLMAGAIPRVPKTFAPGASPPTMPPVAQTQMPSMSTAMQMPHVPPGGVPMAPRPNQVPQQMRRPGPFVR